MLTEISLYLEAAWAAQEFNRHTSNPISLPLSMEDMEQRLKAIDTNLSIEVLGAKAKGDNITVKEYVTKSVQACFQDNQPGSAIDKKREFIEKQLNGVSQAFVLQKTA